MKPRWIFLSALVLDQLTKQIVASTLAVGESISILPGLWIAHVHNTGSVWGFFQDTNGMFIWIAVFIFGLLLYLHDRFKTNLEKLSYALIMAGLWGNLLDRVFRGFVLDFIAVGWWPVFNVADSAITAAIVLLLIEQIRATPQNSSRSES